jgi:hypothetical protein
MYTSLELQAHSDSWPMEARSPRTFDKGDAKHFQFRAEEILGLKIQSQPHDLKYEGLRLLVIGVATVAAALLNHRNDVSLTEVSSGYKTFHKSK